MYIFVYIITTQFIDTIVCFIATGVISNTFPILVANMQDFLFLYINGYYYDVLGIYLLLRFSYILATPLSILWNPSLYDCKTS